MAVKRSIKQSTGTYTEVGNFKRFIPLHVGMCYIRDSRNGNNYHLKVNSESFNKLVSELIEILGKDRIVDELSTLNRTYPNSEWLAAYNNFK